MERHNGIDFGFTRRLDLPSRLKLKWDFDASVLAKVFMGDPP